MVPPLFLFLFLFLSAVASFSSLLSPLSSLLLRAVALFRLAANLSDTKSVHGAYAAAGDLICLLQTCSFLEVVHAAIGLVPSGAMLALMQWGGRTHFLLAIVRQIPEVQELPSVFITFMAWSLSEVLEKFPVWLMYQALPYIKERNLYADFFSRISINYYSFVVGVLLCYPVLWLKLYLHLFKQRQSKLGKHQKKKIH